MTRRHINDEAFALAASHALERICHFRMVPPRDERRPHLSDELEEPLLAQIAPLELGQLLQLGQQQLLLVQRQLVQDFRNILEADVGYRHQCNFLPCS